MSKCGKGELIMKNKEKFAKEIVEIAIKSGKFAIRNGENEPKSCEDVTCLYCLFKDYTYCPDGRKKWAEAEYIEKKVFTEEEKALLIALSKINWVAKDKNGDVYLYSDKPSKIAHGWGWDLTSHFIRLQTFSDIKFESINWEDEEPTSREEILK